MAELTLIYGIGSFPSHCWETTQRGATQKPEFGLWEVFWCSVLLIPKLKLFLLFRSYLVFWVIILVARTDQKTTPSQICWQFPLLLILLEFHFNKIFLTSFIDICIQFGYKEMESCLKTLYGLFLMKHETWLMSLWLEMTNLLFKCF